MGIRRTSGADYGLSNPVESFADVVRRVVLQPVRFFAGLPRSGSLLNPLVFALICTEIAAIFGGILSLARVGGAFVTGYGFEAPENQGLGEFIGSVVFAPIGSAIGVFIVAGIAHLLVRLVVGARTRDSGPPSGCQPTRRSPPWLAGYRSSGAFWRFMESTLPW